GRRSGLGLRHRRRRWSHCLRRSALRPLLLRRSGLFRRRLFRSDRFCLPGCFRLLGFLGLLGLLRCALLLRTLLRAPLLGETHFLGFFTLLRRLGLFGLFPLLRLLRHDFFSEKVALGCRQAGAEVFAAITRSPSTGIACAPP